MVVGARPSAATGACTVTPDDGRAAALHALEQRRLRGQDVVPAVFGQERRRATDAGDDLEGLRPRLPAVGPVVVGGAHTVRLDAAQQVGLQHEDAGVGAVPLVRRRHERVDPPAVDVDREVRRAGDGIDVEPGAGGVGHRRGGTQVGREAGEVRGARRAPPTSHRPRSRAASRSARSSDPSAGSTGSMATSAPASWAARTQGVTFESWSSWVHTMRSPPLPRAGQGPGVGEHQARWTRRRRSPARRPAPSRPARPRRARRRPSPRCGGWPRRLRRCWPAPGCRGSRAWPRSPCRPAGCPPARRGGPSRRRDRGSASGDRAASPPQHAPVRSGPGKSPADEARAQRAGRRRLGGAEAHIAQRRHADGPEGAPATGGPSRDRPEQRQAGGQGAVVAVGPEPGRGRRRQRAAGDRCLRTSRARTACGPPAATP